MAEKIAEMVREMSGNIPFVVAVCHDGLASEINGRTLPLNKTQKPNDSGTHDLAVALYNSGTNSPHTLFQNIERKRTTHIIRLNFYERVLAAARCCLDEYGRCYLLDLHASVRTGNFDIVFGTDRGATVDGDFDKKLANLLEEDKELRVDITGGLFGATGPRTLARWIRTQEPRAQAIQMEISTKWLRGELKRDELAFRIYIAMHTLLDI